MAIPCFDIIDHKGNKMSLEDFKKKYEEDEAYRNSFNKAREKASKPKTQKEVEDINEIKKQAQDIFKAAIDAVSVTKKTFQEKARVTSEAVEKARVYFRDALKNKKINASQYKTAVNKLSTIARASESKLETAVNDFTKYIDRIGEMADIRASFSDIEKSREKARSDMSKARTFTDKNDVDVFKNFLDKINPKMIPSDLFQDYTDVLHTLADTKGLASKDARLLVQKANGIYGKYLNDVVSNYNNISFYLDRNPTSQEKPLEEIVDDMEKEGLLTSEQKNTILDNPDIFDFTPKTDRAKKTPYDASEKKKITDNIISKSKEYENRLKKQGRSSHIGADDRKIVDSVIDGLKKNGKKWMDTLSDRELDKVNHIIEMMNNDFITGDLNRIVDRGLDNYKKTKILDSQMPIIEKTIKGFGKLKNILSKDLALSARTKSISSNLYNIGFKGQEGYKEKAVFEQANRYLRHAIDDVFGTSDGVLNKLFYAKNASNYGQHIGFIETKENEYINPITKVVNNFFKGDTNAMVKFYTKITMYEQQRQVNLNESAGLSDMEAMVKNIPLGQKFYEETDLKNINEELDRFKKVGLQNHENYFNEAFTGKERELALDYVRKADEFYDNMQEKAVAAAKKEGKVLDLRDKYRPVDFVYNGIAEVTENEIFEKDLDKFTKPSLTSGNIKESEGSNGGKKSMLNFTNPVKSMEGYLRSISLQYHCKEDIVRTYKLLNDVMNDNSGKYSKEKKDFAEFMEKNIDLSVHAMASDAIGVSLLPSNIEKAIQMISYHKISGLTKGIGELAGNAVNSTIHLKSMGIGLQSISEIKNKRLDVDKIVYNLGFSQPDRIGNIIPKSDVSASNIDIIARNKNQTSLKSVSKFRNAIDKLSVKSGIKKGREKVGNVADLTFTPADKAAATIMSLGIFTSKFKGITGKSINWEKIQNGDVEYLDKYKDAIEQSIFQSNSAVTELISTKNPWEVAANTQVLSTDSVSKKLYTKVDSFLRSYGKANSTSSYIAIKKAQNKEGSWGEAARTFATKAGSNYAYTAATTFIYGKAFALIGSALGLKMFQDDEEEEGKLTRNILSAGFQTATGSSGNFGQGVANFGLSKIEDLYGEGITREGVMTRGNRSTFSTYDPNKSNWENALNSMKVGGSYSIAESDANRLEKDIEAHDYTGVALDIAPVLGKVPLLKDIQNIKSKVKYQSIPSVEDQKEIYKSNDQNKIKELEFKIKNYTKATLKNKVVGILKEKGRKEFERLFSDPSYSNKVENEIKRELIKNIHVPLSEGYNDVADYLEQAKKEVSFDYLVRTKQISKDIQRMYQMKDEDLKDELVKRARDAKNNPKELEKVQQDLNILHQLDKVGTSVIKEYQKQEIKSNY